MSRIAKSNIELFPPNDRELTLRAQIKTGWSTISSHKISQGGLTSAEIQQIKEVLEKAQVLDHMEEVRIGLQMLKHKQMIDKCRGNGTTTCRICSRDFSHQQAGRPEPIKFCNDCQMVVCSRCKTPYKCLNGESILLCNICYGERELWKRSGSWLNNSNPVVTIPLEDLEEIQHQNDQTLKHGQRSYTAIGRKRDSSPEEFVNPYQLEAEDSDDDDDIPSLSGSFSFNPSQDVKNENVVSQEKRFSESDVLQGFPDPSTRQRSHTGPESPSRGLNRRVAMSGLNKSRLQNSRDRALSRSASSETSRSDSRSLSPSIIEAVRAKVDSGSSHPLNKASVPEIKIRKPSQAQGESVPVVTMPNAPGSNSPVFNRPSSPDSEQEEPLKRKFGLIRQMHKEGSTDSADAIILRRNSSPEPDDSRIKTTSNTTGMTMEPVKTVPPADGEFTTPMPEKSQEKSPEKFPQSSPDISPHTSPDKSPRSPHRSPEHEAAKKEKRPVPQPRKYFQEEQRKKESEEVLNEFNKVSVHQSPQQDEFSKVTIAASSVVEDEFKKVGDPPPIPEKRTEATQSANVDEFQKVDTHTFKSPARTSQATDTHSSPRREPKADPDFIKVDTSKLTHQPSSKPALPPPRSAPSINVMGEGEKEKPVIPSRSRKLLPEIPKKLDVIGKQDSNTSAASSVLSEISTTSTVERDYVTSDVSSIISTESIESLPDQKTELQKSPDPSLDHPRRPIGRKNATRISRNVKRPPPKPRVSQEDQEKQHSPREDADIDDATPRFRTRSGAVKRPANRRGLRVVPDSDSGPGSFPQISEDNQLTLEDEFTSHRSRSSSATMQDRALARPRGMVGSTDIDPPADGTFGSIQVTLVFDEERSELKVTIHKCKGLRAMDSNGFSDPYVKLFLLPGNKKQRYHTKTISKNLNPVFQETLIFTSITREIIEAKKLCAVVMDYDEFSKDDLIGGTQISLYEILNISTRAMSVHRLLDDRSVPSKELLINEKGTIHLSIHFSSELKGLVVNVISASNIGHTSKSHSESYVKCHWTTKRHTMKVRTKNSAKTNNPIYNEDLVFPSPLRDLTYSTLVVGVYESRSLKDKLIGEVQFKSIGFWKSFINDPNQVIRDWYPLEAASPSIPSYTATLPRHM